MLENKTEASEELAGRSLLESAVRGIWSAEQRDNTAINELYSYIFENKECEQSLKATIYLIRMYLLAYKNGSVPNLQKANKKYYGRLVCHKLLFVLFWLS